MKRSDRHRGIGTGKPSPITVVRVSFAMARTAAVSVLCLGILLILPTGLSKALAGEKVQLSNPAVLPSTSLKTIIVDNYHPYTFLNDKGVPDGFSVEIAKAVARVMDLQLEIGAATWEYATKALSDGTIDLLPMMAYSPERDKTFDFSPPHTIAYDAIFSRTGAQKIRSLKELADKTVIVLNGDIAHQHLASSGLSEKMNLLLVDSLPDVLRTLAMGKGDAALMPKLVGLVTIKNLNLKNIDLSPVVIDAYNRPFCFAVKAGNQALLERLSQGLSIIKSTEQYQEIYQKWFGTLEPPGLSWATVIKYIGAMVAFFSLIGSGLILWTVSLRKQVSLRTKKLEVEIQERKQVEEELKRNQRLLSETGSIGKVGGWEFNIDTGVQTWTEEIYQIHEVDPSFDPTVEKGVNFYAPASRPIIEQAVQRTIEHGEPYDLELEIITAKGNLRSVHAIGKADLKNRRVYGFFQDITERKQIEEKIRAALLEKETMLKEIHHRVKNNLQVISSLLGLQSSHIKDPESREVFLESQTRVKIMAQLHTMLYQSADLARVDFGGFILDLVGRLQQSYGMTASPVEVDADIAPVSLTIETSIPCGLILNELVSNALKHAFPEGRGGILRIGMKTEEDRLVLTVQDNGIGFPASIDFRKTQSLGLELVNLLVSQMNGTIDMQTDGGTTWVIVFPIKGEREWRNG